MKASILLLLASMVAASVQAEPLIIEAQGIAQGKTKEAAVEAALEDAVRRKSGIRLFSRAQSEISDSASHYEEVVVSLSQGMVQSYEVLEAEKLGPNLHRATVAARIVPELPSGKMSEGPSPRMRTWANRLAEVTTIERAQKRLVDYRQALRDYLGTQTNQLESGYTILPRGYEIQRVTPEYVSGMAYIDVIVNRGYWDQYHDLLKAMTPINDQDLQYERYLSTNETVPVDFVLEELLPEPLNLTIKWKPHLAETLSLELPMNYLEVVSPESRQDYLDRAHRDDHMLANYDLSGMTSLRLFKDAIVSPNRMADDRSWVKPTRGRNRLPHDDKPEGLSKNLSKLRDCAADAPEGAICGGRFTMALNFSVPDEEILDELISKGIEYGLYSTPKACSQSIKRHKVGGSLAATTRVLSLLAMRVTYNEFRAGTMSQSGIGKTEQQMFRQLNEAMRDYYRLSQHDQLSEPQISQFFERMAKAIEEIEGSICPDALEYSAPIQTALNLEADFRKIHSANPWDSGN